MEHHGIQWNITEYHMQNQLNQCPQGPWNIAEYHIKVNSINARKGLGIFDVSRSRLGRNRNHNTWARQRSRIITTAMHYAPAQLDIQYRAEACAQSRGFRSYNLTELMVSKNLKG